MDQKRLVLAIALSVAIMLAFQVFVQVGGVMRLIPLTGVTLPFVSYGGSSIVANAAIIALLLRISDNSTRSPREEAAPAPLYDPDAVAEARTQVVVKSADRLVIVKGVDAGGIATPKAGE